jgi:hypothetical protein
MEFSLVFLDGISTFVTCIEFVNSIRQDLRCPEIARVAPAVLTHEKRAAFHVNR